jgi:hypothetical protein
MTIYVQACFPGMPSFVQACFSQMERAMGIEPTSLAWEARVIPLYDARAMLILRGYHQDDKSQFRQ